MTAMTMRMQLASFDPSEQEFRDVFKIRKAYDDQYSVMGMALPGAGAEDRERAARARREMDEQLKQVLQDRYPDYQRAQDWNYQAIERVTQGNGLPKEAAVKVYDMKAAAEDQARRIRQDASMTPEQRSTALGSVRFETEQAMRTVMGDQAYGVYQNQATWLRRISPDPAAGQ
jgi:hypothetical protein